MSNENSNDPNEAVKQQLRQRIGDELTKIQNGINEVAPSDVVRLPEYHFTQVFLPFFAGDENTMYKANLLTWVNMAGGPYRSVDVIDQNGNVLFRVPPVMDRSAINPVKNRSIDIKGSSLSHVVATVSQLNQIHPTRGQEYLSKELTKRALVMRVPTNVASDLSTWNAIFTRYGRPPIVAMDKDDPSKVEGAGDDKDDFNYDLM